MRIKPTIDLALVGFFRRKPTSPPLPSVYTRILNHEFGDVPERELLALIRPTRCLHHGPAGVRCDLPFDHDMPRPISAPLITHTSRHSSFGEDYSYNWVKP